MEILKYLMENLFFPLIVALIIKFIEKLFDEKWKQVKEKDGSGNYRLFDSHGES